MGQPQRKRRRNLSVQEDKATCSSFNRSSFTNRLSTLKSKAEQLNILCDVPVALVCFEPDGTRHSWPDESTVRDILLNSKQQKQLDLSGVLEHRRKTRKFKKTNTKKGLSLGFLDSEIKKLQGSSLTELMGFNSYLHDKIEDFTRQIESIKKKQIKEDGYDNLIWSDINYAGW
ncbi:hypothetical protein ACFE04_028607 [Oxalis oulophora]